MLNDHIIISPAGPVSRVNTGVCDYRECTAATEFTVEETVSDGYGGYGETVDEANYCRTHLVVSFIARL